MKFFHLSDLHIGKQLHGFSLLEDQRYILDQVLALIQERQPDAVLVAGDIYDKSMPSADAVALSVSGALSRMMPSSTCLG